MKKSNAFVALFALFHLSYLSVSSADQNAPGLDVLFAQLKESNVEKAEQIEDHIWEKWLMHQDENISAMMDEGKLLMNKHDYNKATEVFTEVTEKAPNYAEGWNKLATVRFLLHDHVSSVRHIHRTLALEPRHFGALSGMGLIFLAKGDYRAAHAAFQEVLKISPHSQSAKYYVDQIEEFLGDPA